MFFKVDPSNITSVCCTTMLKGQSVELNTILALTWNIKKDFACFRNNLPRGEMHIRLYDTKQYLTVQKYIFSKFSFGIIQKSEILR